jgi:predicted GIY-YIG superfamily endonuclease
MFKIITGMYYLYVFKTKNNEYFTGITKNMQGTIISFASKYQSKVTLVGVRSFKKKAEAKYVLDLLTQENVINENLITRYNL